MAKIAAVEDQTVVGLENRFERLVHVKRVYRRRALNQFLPPLGLGRASGAQFFYPWELFPLVIGRLVVQLVNNAGDVADYANIDAAITADLQRRRIDRSEERRVGKECRCRWRTYLAKK